MGGMGLIGISALCVLFAAIMARREWRLYNQSRDSGAMLFPYSKRRLMLRLTGLLAVLAVGVTLGAWTLLPPASPQTASAYLAAFGVEVTALVLFPVLDLFETRKSATLHPEAERRQSREKR